jgi:hypothetical protein
LAHRRRGKKRGTGSLPDPAHFDTAILDGEQMFAGAVLVKALSTR